MEQYIFQDLNVRDTFVTPSTDFLIVDSKAVVQSIWRLITTQEGEIPNFRSYGLNIKQFSQYPLNKDTIQTIYGYIKNRVSRFEQRGEVIKTDVNVDIEGQTIYYDLFVRVKKTGELIKLPTWTINVGPA